MRRGTIFVVLFIITVVVILGVSALLDSQPPIEVRIVASPLLRAWLDESIASLNASRPAVGATNQQVVYRVVEYSDDYAIWSLEGQRAFARRQPSPQVWIPALSASVQYADTLGYRIDSPSVARTLLVWGAFRDRARAATGSGANPTPLDWDNVQRAINADRWAALPGGVDAWGTVNLGFSNPTRTIVGIASSFSAVGHFANTTQVTGSALDSNDVRAGLRTAFASVSNYATFGTSVVTTMAARGPSVADIGMATESEWLMNLTGQLTSANAITLHYPASQVVFDFPLAVQAGATADPQVRAAVDQLTRWLLAAERQARTGEYGLRPASGFPGSVVFLNAQLYGIRIDPPLTRAVTPPRTIDVQRLLDFISAVIR